VPHVDVALSTGPSTVHYRTAGRGPGLVAVHGTGATAESNWTPLIEALAGRYTIVAPDLSGSGATTDPGGPIHLADLVTQVTAAAHHAGLTRYHLVGHSLGAVVATAVAARHPGRVTGLVAHAPWITADPHLTVQFRLWEHLARTDPAATARLVLLTAMGKDTLAAWSREDWDTALAGFTAHLTGMADGFARQSAADAATDLTADLPRITAPTLVIASGDDRMVPTRHQHAVADRIPGARLLRVPGGHGLPAEHPDRFVTEVARFLDPLGAGDPAEGDPEGVTARRG
jgi:pimeloyl-ACP methyl ester carboxylesterase